ncbi:MAG: acetyltransferase [Chitinophagales bacterium]|nr:acetyltransferase [Chitinophagales bacterium]
MRNTFLLGYSEAMIAMVLETRKAQGLSGKVFIILNQDIEEKYPYLPSGVQVEKIAAPDWKIPSNEFDLHFGVGKTATKKLIYAAFEKSHGLEKSMFTNLVHPSLVIASSVKLSTGIYGEPASVLSPFAEVGFGVTINRGVTIGHHTVIGDFVSINPGTHIAGHCHIGNDVLIGMGTSVFDHVSIGEGSVIGGGSVVTKDIPAGVLAYGQPCKVIRSLHDPV